MSKTKKVYKWGLKSKTRTFYKCIKLTLKKNTYIFFPYSLQYGCYCGLDEPRKSWSVCLPLDIWLSSLELCLDYLKRLFRCLKIYLNTLLALGHKSLVLSKIKACSKQCHLIQEKPFKLDFHKVTLSQKKKKKP